MSKKSAAAAAASAPVPTGPGETSRDEIGQLLADAGRDRLAGKIRRLIDRFIADTETLSDTEADIFEQVIGRLIAIADPDVKEEIARWVAAEADAPAGIVEQLANDDWIEVARPILIHSECLDDEALLGIISRRGPSHLLAVARRSQLASTLTDALIVHGNEAVMRALSHNPGASFSDRAPELIKARRKVRLREHRKSVRKAVYYPAELKTDEGAMVAACTLVDVSRTGARLRMGSSDQVPRALRLVFTGRDGGVIRECERVWHDGKHIGVRFV
ncbi:DUF2336 domain-containing protein [Phreatobacter aquaticus]|uniref:DUF2336 domain-containing protein n=1 Tax=Phreatobacter aquaticus TaxID=2570229 RepID=A0A4D7QLL9_9HYPH|nr:DUF2336 domain-containing protein [Phreatobacter aquaticus]QCK86266.1 DUF2336 domain-containing protein [Phreatobacter aquaticus]